MPLTDPIAAGLDRRFEACCQSRAARRAADRWQTDDALRGLSLRDIRRRLATGRPDHNPVLAAMLGAHQSGDGDATTVLLAAFIPYVHNDSNVRLNAERIADRWAALGHLLAVADPAAAEHPDETRSFLYVLIGRMRRDAARLRLGQPDTVADHDLSGTTAPDIVENQALARLELASIGTELRAGTIKHAHWNRLVTARIHGTPDRARRGAIEYTTHRLAALIGHGT